MNPDPIKARLARRRKRKAGDLPALKRAIWQSVRDTQLAAESAVTIPEICQTVHALAAISNSYTKVLQGVEVEARLAQLEAQVAALQQGSRHGVLEPLG
jgi:hypothetical protein